MLKFHRETLLSRDLRGPRRERRQGAIRQNALHHCYALHHDPFPPLVEASPTQLSVSLERLQTLVSPDVSDSDVAEL